MVKTAECLFIPEFIDFEAHFLEYCRFPDRELFLSNPYIFVVLKVRRKSSAPRTETKPHFRAWLQTAAY